MKVLDLITLSNEIWKTLIPEGFKPPSLAKFDGHRNSYEHIVSINTQMNIIRVPDSLKCKIFSYTFRDEGLQWYIRLPRASISSYQDLVKKLVH